jgi:hypothetical protein
MEEGISLPIAGGVVQHRIFRAAVVKLVQRGERS